VQTNGGLQVDTHLRVVDGTGAPIPGLYAVGNAGQGGVLLMGYGHHLGWAFTSGRLAGRHAAHETAHRAPDTVPQTTPARTTVELNPGATR
jgi:fumarate reductase flavoprotein subunit